MARDIFTQILKDSDSFCKLLECVSKKQTPCDITGLSAIHKAHFLHAFTAITGKKAVLITPDEASASKCCRDIHAMSGTTSALLFESREFNFRSMDAFSSEYQHRRLGVLHRLILGDFSVLALSPEALLQRVPPKSRFLDYTRTISAGQTLLLDAFLSFLVSCGYVRREQVEGPSQFALRGGILDVFSPQLENPVRIELFGDEVDSIWSFDLESQRRCDVLSKVQICPASEVFCESPIHFSEILLTLSKDPRLSSSPFLKKTLLPDLERSRNGVFPMSLDPYMSLLFSPASVLDYMDDFVLFVSEYSDVKEAARGVSQRFTEDIKILLEEGVVGPSAADCMESFEILPVLCEKKGAVVLDTFPKTIGDFGLKALFSVNALTVSPWSGDLSVLCDDLAENRHLGYASLVLTGTEKSTQTLVSDLKERGFRAELSRDQAGLLLGAVKVRSGNLSSGFCYPELKVSVHSLMKSAGTARKSPRRFKKGNEITSLSELHIGDAVVHYSHGIGIYDGIHKLQLQGVTKDYLKIKYAGSDILYIPVTQLDLVSRYVGSADDGKIKLNRLHSVEWQRTKERAKKAVSDMADELIALYSKRSQTPGFAFSQDSPWQQEFEDRFEYEETDDQLRCTEEIKADMMRSTPMDRLLCGDVGFGKTEVALRAAFKCILDGKQCAILVPTTILAQQHYQNITRRFEGTPVTVELLSRFRSKKEQAKILKKLKSGEVDCVIGTHRLIQDDVIFKDLGLLVIDEEQRFGVAHKEKLKKLFLGVDVLTLSATPIPRTLNMALSGVRDMSVIDEAPADRHPVETYVIEQDYALAAEAIRRELRRGGQVFYLHNRIESITAKALKLSSLVPEAKVAVAHGKMDEKELADIFRALLEGEINLLVCTTIIETGIDIANCNTLIIEDADKMGLSQLYQLRGRIGRSSRRAYAYFLFRPDKVLTEIASKRLAAIREFVSFGSGFKIALRDLEIRGAGSILSGNQSGHLEAVGYDVYMKLLSEVMAEKKGEPQKARATECLIDIQADAYIPGEYISDETLRIDIYKKIAGVRSEEDVLDLTDELIDRFGDPPSQILSLIRIAMLRNRAAELGIKEISEKGQNLIFRFESFRMDTATQLVKSLKGRVLVNASENPYISVKKGESQSSSDTIEEVLGAAIQYD